ncbi:unnamed protein product [Rhizoctonia solani]|uniref:beta-galactosidase n=1 Tax=Rhizoctonia solani TaxID=456999 RepID=A0A8H2XHF3_9AGAM|nr:unnamed protein product [Rhizoctonia solani]
MYRITTSWRFGPLISAECRLAVSNFPIALIGPERGALSPSYLTASHGDINSRLVCNSMLWRAGTFLVCASHSLEYVPSPGSLGFYAGNSSAAVTFDQHSLLLDGRRIMVFSGEFHPWRLPSTALWRDVLEKMKPAGFDAVSIYFYWRLSESKRGNLNFEEYRSVTRFLEIAKDVGILVIVRPGPYINAETTGGGYPGWLTNVPDTARSNGSDFTTAWKPYIRAVSEYTAPYQYPNGPVILVQSGNEYSMDNPSDKTTYGHTDHMKWVTEETRSSGITRVPITHNDRKPDGQFASGPAKVDLYAWDAYPLGFDRSNPDVHQKRNLAEPLYLAEYQGGAFDPWSGPGYGECYKLINEQFANVFYKSNYAAETYLQNLYMTYGGTNWGNLATPTVYTSYDYATAFLHATPHYHLAGRISTDATHASPNYIWTTHLTTTKGQNLYIIRQTSTTRTGRAEFDFKVNTTAGKVVLHSVALNGRERKIIVSEYPFGNSLLAYTSAEVATWTTIDGQDNILLYISNQTTITGFYTNSTSKPIVSGSSSVTASISNGTALISGVPLSNGLVRVAVGNTSVPRTGSVLVFGPYLARNATINGSTLDITGDAQSATTTKLEVLAPSIIEHVTFDGQPVTVSKSTTGTLKGSIRVKDLAPKLPNLLKDAEWKYSLPEVALDFDDSEWITANKTLTLRPARFRPLAGKTVLYSGEYGFHHGKCHVVYRGRFEGNATGVRLFVQGSYSFGFSTFLNGQFLGSGQGRAATDPAGQLDLICDVYLFRSCGQRGECGYCCDRQHGIGARLDFGRCLRGWTFNELSNFVDGKARLPVEFNSTGCSPSAGITLDRAGTTAYKTKLTLDIDKHADVPLAFRFERTLGKSYRVMVYVSGWQFGKFVSNFGPQTVYPVPEGILDHRGENNVVLVLWSLDGAGANVANVELIATNVLFSSKEVINGLVN